MSKSNPPQQQVPNTGNPALSAFLAKFVRDFYQLWFKVESHTIDSDPPAASTDPGRVGTITWDSNYLYIKVSETEWKRVTLSSF